MFGYITASQCDISDEEKARYRALYCGLCRTIEERYGQISRMSLTYDLTFLAMLFGSLYEPVEETGSLKCPLHPVKTQDFARTSYADYAADLTIAFAYHKCIDDWRDEKKILMRGFGQLLKGPYAKAHEHIPAQCEAIETALSDITAMESENDTQPDDAANRFGRLLGSLFAYQPDQWADAMGQLGTHLGRFVYLMDAAVDYDDDRKSGSYNPFVTLESTPEDMKTLLAGAMGKATEAFEKLPLIQDAHLLRSVLYAGVWQKFNEKYEKDKHD